MADPWIKMRTNLDSDPRVVSVAVQLKVSVATVIGALHFLWSCADTFSRDGYIAYTPEYIDRRVELPGFCDALMKLTNKGKSRPWLKLESDGVSICNFKDHNGETAKERAKAAKRMASSRSKNVPKERNTIGTNPQPEQSRAEQSRREAEASASSGVVPAGVQPASLPTVADMLRDNGISGAAFSAICGCERITPQTVAREVLASRQGSPRSPSRVLAAALLKIGGITLPKKGPQSIGASLSLAVGAEKIDELNRIRSSRKGIAS